MKNINFSVFKILDADLSMLSSFFHTLALLLWFAWWYKHRFFPVWSSATIDAQRNSGMMKMLDAEYKRKSSAPAAPCSNGSSSLNSPTTPVYTGLRIDTTNGRSAPSQLYPLHQCPTPHATPNSCYCFMSLQLLFGVIFDRILYFIVWSCLCVFLIIWMLFLFCILVY